MKRFLPALLVTQILFLAAVGAQENDSSEVVVDEIEDVDFDEALDEEEIDVQGSIGDVIDRRGFGITGDLRTSYVFDGEDIQDVTFGETDVFRLRWRLESTFGFSERFRGVARIAGLCSTEDCDPEFILQPDIPTRTSIKDGQITIDSFFLQWFRTDRFDLAVGRMETKFVARGGVFSKSLDRNDSNNTRVNWTDGAHGTYRAKNGWVSHMIVQYNSSDGPGNIQRFPLDTSDSRQTYFLSFEKLRSQSLLIQRAFDITYMPSSLRNSELSEEPLDDYWGFVARIAGRWPLRSDGWRLRLSSELGYAPNTQERNVSNIAGEGVVDGFAWNLTLSLMDFFPGHSIGVNYARTEAGWLLSPQYDNNEELQEIRYVWRPTNRLSVDVRGRWRDRISQPFFPEPDRSRFDFYARFTWSFTLNEF